MFVVAKLDIQFKKSAKLDDMLLIKTKLMGIKKCSLFWSKPSIEIRNY
jgi:acyl-CoA thioesterase FadM